MQVDAILSFRATSRAEEFFNFKLFLNLKRQNRYKKIALNNQFVRRIIAQSKSQLFLLSIFFVDFDILACFETNPGK